MTIHDDASNNRSGSRSAIDPSTDPPLESLPEAPERPPRRPLVLVLAYRETDAEGTVRRKEERFNAHALIHPSERDPAPADHPPRLRATTNAEARTWGRAILERFNASRPPKVPARVFLGAYLDPTTFGGEA